MQYEDILIGAIGAVIVIFFFMLVVIIVDLFSDSNSS